MRSRYFYSNPSWRPLLLDLPAGQARGLRAGAKENRRRGKDGRHQDSQPGQRVWVGVLNIWMFNRYSLLATSLATQRS